MRASVVAAQGLSTCDAGAQLPHSMWYLLGPGTKPMSSAFASRFLTTGLPGKLITWEVEPTHGPFL